MGLCREKVESRSILDRNVEMVLPVDKCVEHEDAIKTCMIEEGKCYIYIYIYISLLKNIIQFYPMALVIFILIILS